ncbi:DegT/DnrJ/EryC1/StrS family aminotransferase [Micromonospora sp. CPCC 205558]|uniref:DegT/DnrJ/EryC1/StrS family aminotransferase n=1 Tax=Micromonospora sp. CPCC 205558 TaxID=3122403 RepID=UPI002FF2799D
MPMRAPIHLSSPDVGPAEEAAVLRALRSGWATPFGPEVDAFEQEIAQRVGVPYALALNSGTAALHLGLLSCGVGPEHIVLVPTVTFVATANAVLYTGATPVFVDCDPATGNVDVNLLGEVIADLRRAGRRIGAVMPVDMFGSCVDYDPLLELCREAELRVIEDSAEALGSTYRGRCAGSFGDAGVLSFSHNKMITTSGGGMLLSHDAQLITRARHRANQARIPAQHHEHDEMGFNYRLSNVLAAFGRAQLARLDEMTARRRHLREHYSKLFASVDGVEVLAESDPGTNCWLTVITVDPELSGWQAADLARHLAQADIETRPAWKPMHRQPLFAAAEARLTGAADRLFARGLTLPSGSSLNEKQIDRITGEIHSFLRQRS